MEYNMENMSVMRNSGKQDKLIQQYCEEAASLLASAQDFDTAVRLKDVLCERFRKECDSALVVTATERYIDDLFKQRWESPDREDNPQVDNR